MNSIGIVGGEGTISNPAGLLIMNLPTILCAIIVARYGPGAWALAFAVGLKRKWKIRQLRRELPK